MIRLRLAALQHEVEFWSARWLHSRFRSVLHDGRVHDEVRARGSGPNQLYNAGQKTQSIVARQVPARDGEGGIVFDAVTKIFRRRSSPFAWFGREDGPSTIAVSDVSFHVPKGEVFVILGPNGSGKTTTLKLVSTVLLPDSGRVLVEGFDTRLHPECVRARIGFAVASERSFFPRLTARENLDFFAALDDVPRRLRRMQVDCMLERVELTEVADTLVMKFSSGMYQRLAIARALIKKPSVILLDEPTRSLDPGSATNFWQLVRDLAGAGAAVLLSSHRFSEAAEVADSVAVLQQGKLVAMRRSNGASASEFKSFYFDAVGGATQPLAWEEVAI